MSSGPQRYTSSSSSAYDAFSTVDSLVSKPIMGSDGAASWQQFQSESKSKSNSIGSLSQSSRSLYQSRGAAPHLPLKRNVHLRRNGFDPMRENLRSSTKLYRTIIETNHHLVWHCFGAGGAFLTSSERKGEKRRELSSSSNIEHRT